MKVTKQIIKTFEQLQAIKNKEERLMKQLYGWMEDQGVDTFSDEFADGIGVRIENNEFASSAHFFEDLKMFIDGHDVGYG